MILRPPYVQTFRDRHGKLRFYLRRRGHKAVPLPDKDDPGFLAAYTEALATTAPPEPSRVLPGSLEALARSYFTSSDFKRLGSTTQAAYRRLIGNIVQRHGAKPIRLLDAIGVRRILDALANTPSAANHTLRSLRAMMRHAIETGLRSDDPTRGVRRQKEKAQGVATWSEADIAAFETRWPIGTKARLALALLLYTGQRRSDVVRMGRQHVRANVIEVRQVKTGHRLMIPLHPDLAGQLAAQTDRLTFLMTDEGDSSRPYTANGFYMRFRDWVAEAGLPAGLSPHGLRKAAARRMAEAGCSAHQIAAVTGHKTLAEVQRYTIAADQERLARAAVLHLGRPETGTPRTNRARKSVKPASK